MKSTVAASYSSIVCNVHYLPLWSILMLGSWLWVIIMMTPLLTRRTMM